jgi:hypothetical protein
MADVAAILAEIEAIYYKATPQSIHTDFARAIDLLKQLPDEDTRSRAAVYMEGLADMRTEWADRDRAHKPRGPRPPKRDA